MSSTKQPQNELQTTSWDNTKIYSSFADPKINTDLATIESTAKSLQTRIETFAALIPQLAQKTTAELSETIGLARDCYRQGLDARTVMQSLGTYASTALSVDAIHGEAKDLQSRVSQVSALLQKALVPLELFLARAPQSYLEEFLKDDRVEELTFSLMRRKERSDFLLEPESEVLLEGHAVDGFHAWGRLYTDMAGAMKVSVGEQTLGLAQASNLLFQDDRSVREQAYRGINQAWLQHEIPAAAILNSINGWRLENSRARSKKKELHYLDESCHQSRITRETLNALMGTTYKHRDVGQRALRLMAREIGVEKLGPWDTLAAFPADVPEKKMSFPEAMELIIEAFGKFAPDMAEFARHMWEQNWIDATPTPNRGSGAYCTRFATVREPRVFITYEGNMKNVITLAHELGHAYHNWVMRDMKPVKTHYTMTLAETASIFAETLVRDAILERAKTTEEKKKILWMEIEAASNLMINIPARYEMEKRMVELRKTKSATAAELRDLTRESWKMWYGDTLTEYADMFWATKLHFAITHVSFYNYPYLFGYLFSLGIYAEKDKHGDKFRDLYVNVLRDTGTMTAEDLVQKYFNRDIRKPEFWENSIQIVDKSIKAYEALV